MQSLLSPKVVYPYCSFFLKALFENIYSQMYILREYIFYFLVNCGIIVNADKIRLILSLIISISKDTIT